MNIKADELRRKSKELVTLFLLVCKIIGFVFMLVAVPIIIVLVFDEIKNIFIYDYTIYISYSIAIAVGMLFGVFINIKSRRKEKENKNETPDSRWSKKDWLWLSGIMVGIIILLVANWLGEDKLLSEQFSFASNLVSITLGLVAIFYAFNQSKISISQNSKLDSTLNDINNKVLLLSSLKEDFLNMQSMNVENYDKLLNAVGEIQSQIIADSNGTSDKGETDRYAKIQRELENLKKEILVEKQQNVSEFVRKSRSIINVPSPKVTATKLIKVTNYRIKLTVGNKFNEIDVLDKLYEHAMSYSFNLIKGHFVGEVENRQIILVIMVKGKGRNNSSLIINYMRTIGNRYIQDVIDISKEEGEEYEIVTC